MKTGPFLSLLFSAGCALQLAPAQTPVHAAAAFLPLCGTAYTLPTGGFPRVIHAGTRPQGAVVSRRGHAFIPLSGTNGIGGSVSCRSSVTTIDTSTGRFIRSVPVGAVSPVAAVDDADGRVFVASYTKRLSSGSASITITALDLQGRIVRALPALSICPCAGNALGPLTVGVDSRHARFFLFTYQSVIAFNARTIAPLKTVALDSGSAGGGPNYAIDARQGRVFVATQQGVTVLRSSTGAVVQRIDLAASERSLVLDEGTGRLIVGSAGACRGNGAPGNVTILDSATGSVVRTVLSSCAGFLSMLVDEPAGRVLARIQQPGAVIRYAILDAQSGRLLRAISLPSPLDYVAVDARSGKIYNGAVVCTEGRGGCARLVQVLDPHSWRVVRSLAIRAGWQGALTVAPDQRRLLVIGPYNGTITIARTA